MILCWNCPSYPEEYHILSLFCEHEENIPWCLIRAVGWSPLFDRSERPSKYWKPLSPCGTLQRKSSLVFFSLAILESPFILLFYWNFCLWKRCMIYSEEQKCIVKAERINNNVLGHKTRYNACDWMITPKLRQVSESTKNNLISNLCAWAGCLRLPYDA